MRRLRGHGETRGANQYGKHVPPRGKSAPNTAPSRAVDGRGRARPLGHDQGHRSGRSKRTLTGIAVQEEYPGEEFEKAVE